MLFETNANTVLKPFLWVKVWTQKLILVLFYVF